MKEIPNISGGSYTSTVTTGALMMGAGGSGEGFWLDQDPGKRIADFNKAIQAAPQPKEIVMGARIVKVYIADPNENIALENRVLYSGEEKLTDLTDQELFFEVPIADLLAKHNDMRKTVVDKNQSDKFGRDIKLEPVRIRDLKMVVVTVAQF